MRPPLDRLEEGRPGASPGRWRSSPEAAPPCPHIRRCAAVALDGAALAFLLLGALAGGFVTGLAGFGTGLVAAGVWFHALEPGTVPPLVALVSVGGQAVGVAFSCAMPSTGAGPGRIWWAASWACHSVWRRSLWPRPACSSSPSGCCWWFYTLLSMATPAAQTPALARGRCCGRARRRRTRRLCGAVGAAAGDLAAAQGRQRRRSARRLSAVQPRRAGARRRRDGRVGRNGTWPRSRPPRICLPVALAAAWTGARLYRRIDALLFQRIVHRPPLPLRHRADC